jgi:hypothetical protein
VPSRFLAGIAAGEGWEGVKWGYRVDSRDPASFYSKFTTRIEGGRVVRVFTDPGLAGRLRAEGMTPP